MIIVVEFRIMIQW